MYCIYARKSLDRDGLGVSVGNQQRECEEYATRHALAVSHVFLENDTPATGAAHRPKFEEMKQLIQSGEIKGIICTDSDRLWRHNKDLEPLLDLVDSHKLDIRTVRSALMDLSTPHGKLIARQFAATSAFEVEQMGLRIHEAHKHKARKGEWRGGSVPFGYQLSNEHGMLDLHPINAPMLQKAAKDVIAGRTLFAITKEFNEKGVLTSRGNKWSSTALRKAISNATAAGLVTYKGEIIGEGMWPAIITLEDREKILAILKNPARRTNQGTARKYMLSGIAECGRCGGKLGKVTQKSTVAGKKPAYDCMSCFRTSILAEKLDPYVSQAILWHLKCNVDKHLGEPDDLSELIVSRETLLKRQSELSEMFADGLLTRAQLLAGNEKLTPEIESLTRQIDKAAQSTPLQQYDVPVELFEVIWNGLSADSKAATIRSIMRVVVHSAGERGRALDDRVEVIWL